MAPGGLAVVDPAGHAYPALQVMHDVAPATAKLPAAHNAVGGSATTDPAGHAYPALQFEHDVAPATAKRPAGHKAADGLAVVDAAGHAYPAVQLPLHPAACKPCVSPYLPAGQSVQLLAAVADEYRPAAHKVHEPDTTKRRHKRGKCMSRHGTGA
jgi:hypothetical protein